MKNKITRHHKIPKSRGGSNHFDNILKIKDVPHRGFHTVFNNELPHEQISTLITMTWEAFNKAFIADVEDFLDGRTLEEMYNYKCYVQKFLLIND